MKLYALNVKENAKQFYWPNYLWSGVCFIWDIDDYHVYVKFIRSSIISENPKATISSPCRYIKSDIEMTLIEDYKTFTYYEGDKKK